jgi:hypothetical protein
MQKLWRPAAFELSTSREGQQVRGASWGFTREKRREHTEHLETEHRDPEFGK